ncbi:MAG: hypothetical protein M1825_001189 [Sarcosagium campestre]|nr:MAG: hypothetical protein M1825_001189 [Sarcosagium campestre]
MSDIPDPNLPSSLTSLPLTSTTPQQQSGILYSTPLPPPLSPSVNRKRKNPGSANMASAPNPQLNLDSNLDPALTGGTPPAAKKSRTNTPWSPAEEQRLKTMRDAGSSWSEIAKTFPSRTEGSVKKHWYKVCDGPNVPLLYIADARACANAHPKLSVWLTSILKDMHYAEFAEEEVRRSHPAKAEAAAAAVPEGTAAAAAAAAPLPPIFRRRRRRPPPPPERAEASNGWSIDADTTACDPQSAALLAAIKDYETNKWKVIGQKVGKPAKACEQYAKEHFGGKV